MLITQHATQFNTSLWEECLTKIEQRVGSHSFETWFRNTALSFTPENLPQLEVPNQFFADFMEEHFTPVIREVLAESGIKVDSILFTPSKNKVSWKKSVPLAATILKEEKKTASITRKPVQKGLYQKDFTFDKFVVGDNNRFAYTSCLAVAEAPGKTSFNPLTIHGGTGLGKTHLLQAIGNFVQSENVVEHILYMTSQEFINQYINHVREKRDSTSFYKQFTNIDLLLIDDIHFFSGKAGTQNEFFRIFNRLLMQNKQIILSSDRPPEEIPDMMDSMINRFLGGLVTDIQPPNLETRMAILKKKAEIDGVSLPEEVVQFIANHITSNVRELEGTLIKLVASTSFTGKSITLEAAQEIFGDVIARKQHRLTIEIIQHKVAEYFGITPEQLRAHTRHHNIAYPRSIAMYLCKKWTKQALRTIGLDFGGRDYSTVIYSCKKIESESATDQELKRHIDTLDAILKPFAD